MAHAERVRPAMRAPSGRKAADAKGRMIEFMPGARTDILARLDENRRDHTVLHAPEEFYGQVVNVAASFRSPGPYTKI
jgi:hypothetical protein